MAFGLFSLNSYASADVLLERLSGVYRLRGPLEPLPTVEVLSTGAQGGKCGGKPTRDLVLRFNESSPAWLAGPPDIEGGPCQVTAIPGLGGGLELRLSYLVPKDVPATSTLRTLVFRTSSQTVVDHWFENPRVAMSPVKSKGGGGAKKVTVVKPIQAPFLNAFAEKTTWESILGAEARPLDFDSSEMDRFRGFDREQNLGPDKLPIEKRKLVVPLLRFLPLDRSLDFAEVPFTIPDFKSEAAKPTKEQQAAIDGMNFVSALVREKKWLKARESVDILLKSKFAGEIPNAEPRWWALRGYIYIKAGEDFAKAPPEETVKEPDGRVVSKRDVGRMLAREGLLLWSDGLRRTLGQGGGNQAYIEYMAVESVRRLFLNEYYYGAASLIGWLLRYSWPDRFEERFHYLYAESFLKLGMFNEAYELFERYFQDRKGIPISSRIDRRLVPSAAFRLGDIEYRRAKFGDSLKAYAMAFSEATGPAKFTFEGTWYPEEIRHFPTVFLNRVGAAIRLGRYRDALNDLRVFLYVAPTDPDVGLAYYMIGDLLERLGVEKDKIENAWRECVFKVPDSLGARLCQARDTAKQIPGQGKERWPRSIGVIETILPQNLKEKTTALSDVDLTAFAHLLISFAFLEANEPEQALLRLEPLAKMEPSAYLKDWYREYWITGFVGTQAHRLEAGQNREVVAEYEKRRLTFFLGSDRPAALYQIAEAFRKSALWTEALKALDSAEKLRRRFLDAEKRTGDPSAEDWAVLRARLLVGALEKDPKRAREARKAVDALEKGSIEALRLQLAMAKVTRDAKLEQAAWRGLLGKEALTWSEIEAYDDFLAERRLNADREALIESRVGAWFAEREKNSGRGDPPRRLIMKLAEIRSASKQPEESLSVWDALAASAADNDDRSLIAYRKGEVFRRLRRTEDARQSFESARSLAPDGVWGRLSATALRELPSK